MPWNRLECEPSELDALIYGGVCRELFEPATACRVAAETRGRSGRGGSRRQQRLSRRAQRHGRRRQPDRARTDPLRLVVACETAREINEITIARMLEKPHIDAFRTSLATLTGGSGAVAVVLDRRIVRQPRAEAAAGGHGAVGPAVPRTLPMGHRDRRASIERHSSGSPYAYQQFATTDASRRPEARRRLWRRGPGPRSSGPWAGSANRSTRSSATRSDRGTARRFSRRWGSAREKEFCTYPYLGNVGTVSLPITAALAEDREFLQPGDRVALLGIGSGLNCLMLGLRMVTR